MARRGRVGYAAPGMLLALLIACRGEPTPQVRAYADALAAVAADPAQTAARCGELEEPALRGDCTIAGVQALASRDVAAAAAACGALDPGMERDECRFVLAEVSLDPARCADAGRFAEDCRMHLLQRTLSRELAADLSPAAAAEAAAPLFAQLGFSPGDDRPWTVLFRQVLSRQEPLDLGACAGPQEAACRRAGQGLFHDRLNHARDTGKLRGYCAGGPLPALLAHAPHPDLAQILAERPDLCP